MVVSSSLDMEVWYTESDMLECVSFVNDAFGLMRHLLDDELQRCVRLVLQVAKECDGGARCQGIDVLDVEEKSGLVEDSLIHAIELDAQVARSFCGKCDGRRGGLDETARSGVRDG